MRLLLSLPLFTVLAALAPAAPAGPVPEGWTDLMKPDVWKKVDPKWIVTDEVKLNAEKANKLAATAKDGGTVWVNGDGRLPNLYTKQDYGDCEVYMEFVIAKGSNAGLKLHGVYEVQILDSFDTKKKLTGDSMGGIYPRADDSKGYKHIDEGIAPKVNAAKPPGEWQTLDVVWRSPRFDAKGEKTANAVVVKATLNGEVIHENQELKTPTGANWNKKETATGPLMLQADHGPFAFRNVRIKPAQKN
ncbi:3-keto-disaccharide hydrolase [Gemmata sp.]|uniref:3-keto-disaccharide hydrolase n=1 Tax=Gemmata sp. TaxID=1914242 RepID=UPI003F707DBF